MDAMKRVMAILCALYLLIMAWYLRVAMQSQQTGQPTGRETVYDTVYDTVPYLMPVPRDSAVLKNVTRSLPVAEPEGKPSGESEETIAETADSASVVVPITQKKYETEDYRAYVSGYEPVLDSIFVYQNTVKETTTITREPSSTFKDRFGFGIGVGAGYGIVHKQADIFVSAFVYYRIWP